MSKKTGRRPGSQPTRQEIVDAARATFAARGFRESTFRMISEAAGVDPGLITHYFGSKENLFAETLVFPEGAVDAVLAALEGDPAGLGGRLARAYLGLWENPATRGQMMIVSRSAVGGEVAMAHVRPQVLEVLDKVRSTPLPGPNPEERFALAMGQLFGIAAVRHLTAAPPLRDLPFDDLIDLVAPSIQLHLDVS